MIALDGKRIETAWWGPSPAQAPTLLVLDNLETPWEHAGPAIAAQLGELAAIPSVALLASGGRRRPGEGRKALPSGSSARRQSFSAQLRSGRGARPGLRPRRALAVAGGPARWRRGASQCGR